MMAKPRSSPSSTSNLSRCGRRSCSRFRARSAPAYAPSPASANTIQPTVVMVCASCCSCSPYCLLRVRMVPRQRSIGRAASRHRGRRAWSDERRAAGVARRRGLPISCAIPVKGPITRVWSPVGCCSMWSDLFDHRRGDRRRPHRIRHHDSAIRRRPVRLLPRLTAGLGPFQRVRHHHFRGRRPVLAADDYQHPRHRFAGGCAQNRR